MMAVPERGPVIGRAETIAERKARMAYDREHPWTSVSQAVADGTVCELQFGDIVGNFDGGERRFVLVSNARYGFLEWVCINGHNTPWGRPCSFRPTDKVLSKSEIAHLRRKAGI